MMAEGWRRTTVEQLVRAGALTIHDGYRARNLELGQSGLPFARAGNLDGGFHFEGADFLREEHLPCVGEKVSRPGDVVFTSKGTVGRLALVRPEAPRFVYSPQLCFWRVGDARVLDSRFLYYWMHGEEFSRQVDAVKGQTDMADYVSLRDQRRMHLTLPPIAEQRAIAAVLGALDDRIEAGRRLVSTLEAMIQALFQSWFVDREPAGCEPEESLPPGWRRSSLGALFPGTDCVLTGPFGSHLHASDYREEGVPLIQVGSVSEGLIRERGLPQVGAHKLPRLERYRLREGDILFTRVGAVGRTAYVAPRQAGWLISGQMLRVRVPAEGPVHPRYLSQAYRQPSFRACVERQALGTTRPSLNTALLESLPFPLPPRAMQDAFAAAVAPLDRRTWAELDARRTFETLRDTLLPGLLCRGIRVKEAEAQVAAHADSMRPRLRRGGQPLR
jgi:type I restriction enzyme, S subunit